MIKYIAKRILQFIPSLIAISVLAFIINILAPGNPADRMSGITQEGSKGLSTDGPVSTESYWNMKLGLNLPLFYISISPLSVSNFIYNLQLTSEQHNARKLMVTTGNTQAVESIYNHTKLITSQDPGIRTSFRNLRSHGGVEEWQAFASTNAGLPSEFKEAVALLGANNETWKSYIPCLRFHGDNQYHRWIFGDGNWISGENSVISKGLIRGDFGISYQTMQPVTRTIGEKIKWSLLFSIFSILLAYLTSIPAGIFAASKAGKGFDRILGFVVFLFYSIPSFWLATLLLMTFANPDSLAWFPASGVKPPTGYPLDSSLIEKLRLSLPYLILPMICYTYASFAFLTRTLRASMLDNISMDYIRTARAKGVSEFRIYVRHAFRNSLLPLITLFVNIFPLMLGGSVILETIFSIPGMGLETVQAIQNQNYPMVTAIFTITGLLTMTGYLLSDILYAFADPRISFDAENKQD